MPVALYQRMPQLPTMSSNGQQIPRIWMPEAIADGKAEGYRWVGKSIEHQFGKFMYPAPGHSPVKMLYKYGGSILGTMNNTNRHVRMYQSEKLEFVVNQSIWFEGEAKFADVVLPACTNFERTDISEWAAMATTASSSSTIASLFSRRRRSSRSANRSPITGFSTRSANGSACRTTSRKASTRSIGSSASISPPT
jgi:trimethylamine-N-oxide reductase (cytochrome c)